MGLLNLLKYSRGSFSARVFYLFTVTIIIVYISFTAFFIYYQCKTLKQNLIYNGKEYVKHLAYSSRLGVFAENKDLLSGPLEGIMQSEEAILAQVFTINGKVLKTLRRMEEAKPDEEYPEARERTLRMLRKSGTILYFEGRGNIEFWAPVISSKGYSGEEDLFFKENSSRNNNKIIGFVRIIFTTELLNKSIKDIFLKSIFIPVIIMIPGWIIAYFIVRGITKPLGRLTEGVKAIEVTGAFEKVSVDANDEIGRLAQAFNDMTDSLMKKEAEKQQLEEQLRHAQKMEAVGTLAGGIAHDFNNIISVIIGYGRLLQKKDNDEELASQYLDHILFCAGRAAAFTQRLLTFSRKQMINPRPVNLNSIIRNIEGILTRLINEDMDFKVELANEDLIVIADSGQIEQVLMNLTTNARDAMPRGGCLKITTKSVALDRQFFISSGGGRPGRYAMISVADTGTGIDKQIKEKIFDPFFTTKEIGEGTGLGLSMVYGIVRQHDGYIDVSSESGKGTTFKIYIPLSSSVVEDIDSEAAPQIKGGTETILVAEDDENVRELLTTILQSYGYKIIEAVNGSDAIEKFIENKSEIKMILLDVIMPKKNGREVYEEIKKIRPDIKGLYISGHPSDLININGDTKNGISLLPKPILPDDLIRKIREILDG
ncbi:MAG TPA: hybrid sensor histidine kinase/response regulator [Nitrospirae bacterium]|nr:hybrid sensor histidine kinase/response regulator [Nitrospirota bacterium]